MRNLHFKIPMSIFVAGIVICLLSVLDLFSPPTTQVLYKIGAEMGLLGIIAGIIVIAWDK